MRNCMLLLALLSVAILTADAAVFGSKKSPLPRHLYPAKPNPDYVMALAKYRHSLPGSKLPPSINWVKRGAVTPVHTEGQCGGGCVAFSVTGNVEGVNFVTNHKLVPLSAQE